MISSTSPHHEGIASKRESNKVANRLRIIDAARAAFMQLGFDGVTIRDVIRQTGLAAGTFYNYFTDKDSLFKAVLESRVTQITAAMHAVRMRAGTVEGFIHGAYLTLFEQIAHDPSFFRLVIRNEHAVRSCFADTLWGIPLQTLREDLAAMVARGVFPAVDVQKMAAAFYGVGFELGRELAWDPDADPRAYADFATQLLTGGVHAFGISGNAARPTKKHAPATLGSLP